MRGVIALLIALVVITAVVVTQSGQTYTQPHKDTSVLFVTPKAL